MSSSSNEPSLLLGQEPGHDAFYVQLGGVQERNSFVCYITQNQGQLSPAQNQPLYPLVFLEPCYYLQKSLARLRQDYAVNQFTHIFVVDVNLLLQRRDAERDAFPRKDIRIELPLHGKACAKQTQMFQSHRFGRLARG